MRKPSKSRRGPGAFRRDSRGNIAILSALILPILLGTFGLGTEVAGWYGNQRAMQNAADSAAIAAASNAGTDYAAEAKAVATRYGFITGQEQVTVTAINEQACPNGTTQCYRVTITKPFPLLLAQFVGFNGDTTLGGSPAKLITATALAIQGDAPREYCIVTLANSNPVTALVTNGAPNANLAGCAIMSNSNANCNGHDLNADYGDAFGTNDDCGKVRRNNVAKYKDQYAEMADNITEPSCSGSYFDYAPNGNGNGNTPSIPPAQSLAGSYSWSGDQPKCGDQVLTGDVTIDTDSDGAVLVIKNGDLVLNGHTLRTSNGSALTIVFTGDNGSYGHTVWGNGALDIAAPKTGDWAGMAMYQDPDLKTGVDIDEAGNSPSWNITGVVYLPYADVELSGAVGKATNGKSCFVLMSDTLRLNGTANILARGECEEAGVTMPTGPGPARGKLVS
jgi:hypothetical protein